MTRPRWSRGGLREAAAAVAPTVLVLVMSAVSLGDDPEGRDGWMLAVLLAQALPLLVVRRAPRAVLACTVTVTAAAAAGGLPVTNGTAAQAIAAGFVVAHTRWPVSMTVPVVVLAANTSGAWAGGVRDLPRHVVITAMSLILAWVLGDVVRRRAEVHAAIEAELRRRASHHRLQAEVGALNERLTIARELHGIVGEGLDAVVVQAGAARIRLGAADAANAIGAIETSARAVLSELDRFLALLRQEIPERDQDRTRTAMPVPVLDNQRSRWLGRRASAVTLVGTAAAVSALTFIDVVAVPQFHPVPGWWPLAFSAAVGVALTGRRRWPEATLAVVSVLVTSHLAAGIPVENGVVSIPVAAHALIAHRERRRSLVLAVLACVAPMVATAVAEPSATVPLATVLGVLTAVALYAGDTARAAAEHSATMLRRLADVEAEGALRRHAVVVEERTAAARDLHDSVGHALSLIIIQAGAARLAAGAATPSALERAADALSAIENTARSSLEAVEAAVHAGDKSDAVLHQPVDFDSLVQSVRATGVSVQFEAAPTDDLSKSLQSTVFRLVQEALTNVVKHAPGASTSVVVDRSDGLVRVRVANTHGNGRKGPVYSGGRGLTGMRERVALFGGRLDVGPAADGGYLVDATVRVPETIQSADAAPQHVGGPP
jgi:signal transduction histidine kinase